MCCIKNFLSCVNNRLTPYTKKRGKKVEAKNVQNTTSVNGETSNKGLMNAMRSMMEEMLAQKKVQE